MFVIFNEFKLAKYLAKNEEVSNGVYIFYKIFFALIVIKLAMNIFAHAHEASIGYSTVDNMVISNPVMLLESILFPILLYIIPTQNYKKTNNGNVLRDTICLLFPIFVKATILLLVTTFGVGLLVRGSELQQQIATTTMNVFFDLIILYLLHTATKISSGLKTVSISDNEKSNK